MSRSTCGVLICLFFTLWVGLAAITLFSVLQMKGGVSFFAIRFFLNDTKLSFFPSFNKGRFFHISYSLLLSSGCKNSQYFFVIVSIFLNQAKKILFFVRRWCLFLRKHNHRTIYNYGWNCSESVKKSIKSQKIKKIKITKNTDAILTSWYFFRCVAQCWAAVFFCSPNFYQAIFHADCPRPLCNGGTVAPTVGVYQAQPFGVPHFIPQPLSFLESSRPKEISALKPIFLKRVLSTP